MCEVLRRVKVCQCRQQGVDGMHTRSAPFELGLLLPNIISQLDLDMCVCVCVCVGVFVRVCVLFCGETTSVVDF